MPRSGRIGSVGSRPGIGARVISPTGAKLVEFVNPAPDDHLVNTPYGCVKESRAGCVSGASSRPAVRAGIVSSAGV